MKILFISTRWPLPPVTGDRLRSYYILRELARRHDVTLLSFYNSPAEVKMLSGSTIRLKIRPVNYHQIFSYLKTPRAFLSRRPLQIEYFNFRAMRQAIRDELKSQKYDLIFTSMIRAAHYAENITGIPKVVDLIDAVSLTYQRMLHYPGLEHNSFFYWLYSLEQKRVLNYEQHLIKQFDLSLLVSNVDRDYLAQFVSVDKVRVVQNGVNTRYFRFNSNSYHPRRITFHGNIHYQPNTDAVMYFHSEVFPRIKNKINDAKFYVIGNNPRKHVRNLSRHADVYVTGRVNDVRTYLWDTAVSVSPMRIGAGVQNKILEAMAVGAPVVTSSLGFEGIDATPGEHLFVADTPDEFADAVVALLDNPKLRRRIVDNARKLIEEKYQWESTLSPLMEWIEELV